MRSRERCAAEIASLTVALESLQADARSTEAKIEALRTEHYAAGDALHDRQGGFYAANAEVTRLEQQLQFARESENRITREVAQITEQLGSLAAQAASIDSDRVVARSRRSKQALTVREAAAAEEREAQRGASRAGAGGDAKRRSRSRTSISGSTSRSRRSASRKRGARTRRARSRRSTTRRAALTAELDALAAPVTDEIRAVEEQLEQESAELAGRADALAALQDNVQSLQERQRSSSQAFREDSKRLADLEAHEQALAALQAKVGHGEDKDAWLAQAGLTDATQLWRALDVDRGWNDALEATLRERLEALEIGDLDAAIAWESTDASPPVRLALYAPAPGAPCVPKAAVTRSIAQGSAEAARARPPARRCAAWRALPRLDRGRACATARALGLGESFVTPAGHIVTAQTVTLFKPDSELHGVLERQRELEALADSTRQRARDRRERARGARRARGASSSPSSRRITPRASR